LEIHLGEKVPSWEKKKTGWVNWGKGVHNERNGRKRHNSPRGPCQGGAQRVWGKKKRKKEKGREGAEK